MAERWIRIEWANRYFDVSDDNKFPAFASLDYSIVWSLSTVTFIFPLHFRCSNILLLTDFVEVSPCCSCDRSSIKRGHRKKFCGVCNKGKQRKKSKYLTANTKSWAKTKHVFVSTLFCRSNMLNRAFITKTTSGEFGFRNRKSTRDDLLQTDFGVRFPFIYVS